MFVVSQPLKKKSKFIIKTEISKDNNKPFKCYYTSTSVKSINSSSTQNSITPNLKNIFTPSFSSTIPSVNNNINKNIIFNNNNININNINNNKLNNNLINIDNNNQINFPKKTKRPMFKLNFIKSNNNKHKNKNENKCLFNTNNNNNNIIINNDNNNNFITTINNNNNNNNINKKSKRKSNSNIKYSSGRWKEDEHKRFVEAIIKFGNDWKQVQKYVKTRSSTQARSHAQKFFIKLKKSKNLDFNLDLSNSSIKNFHDIIQNVPINKYNNIINVLNNVAFERGIGKKKYNNSNNNNINNDNNINKNEEYFNNNYVMEKEEKNEGNENNNNININNINNNNNENNNNNNNQNQNYNNSHENEIVNPLNPNNNYLDIRYILNSLINNINDEDYYCYDNNIYAKMTNRKLSIDSNRSNRMLDNNFKNNINNSYYINKKRKRSTTSSIDGLNYFNNNNNSNNNNNNNNNITFNGNEDYLKDDLNNLTYNNINNNNYNSSNINNNNNIHNNINNINYIDLYNNEKEDYFNSNFNLSLTNSRKVSKDYDIIL